MPNPRTNARFAKILMEAGLIDDLQLRSLSSKMDSFGWTLPRAMAEMGFRDEDEVVEALGKALRVPTTGLGNVLRDNPAQKVIGADWCEKHLAFPVTLKERVLTLAMTDPTDLIAADEAASKARARVVVMLASETQVRTAIAKHYRNETYDPGRRRTPTVSFEAKDPTLDEPPPPPVDLQRLEAVRETQKKIAQILRTLQELLAAKGLVG